MRYRFEVSVECDTFVQALQFLSERLDFRDAGLGFRVEAFWDLKEVSG